MTAPTAAIYARISDDPTGRAAGVERQEAECRDLCRRLGAQVGEVYVDNDLSATTGKVRPAFEALLAARPPMIVVWHTDRLVRLTRDLERVIDLGVNIHAVTAGHVDLSTPAGRAVARTVTAWATYEGEQKSLRQTAALRQRAASGASWWTSRPFGLEPDGTLREDEARALRAAYDDLLAGVPLSRIAASLTAAGHVTAHGRAWCGATLRKVLLSPRNAGLRTYRGEEVGPGAWSPIIPEVTFRAAVRLLRDPARRRGGGGPRQGMMTGVARCGRCDATVRLGSRPPRRTEDSYGGSHQAYVCKARSCVSYNRAFVDMVVESEMTHRLARPDATRLWVKDQDRVEAVRLEVVEMRERLDALAEDYADGSLSRAQMIAGSERVRLRLEQAERELAQAGAGTALEGLVGVSNVEATWKSLSVDRRRSVVEALTVKVQIMPRPRGTRRMAVEDVVITWRGQQEAPAPTEGTGASD